MARPRIHCRAKRCDRVPSQPSGYCKRCEDERTKEMSDVKPDAEVSQQMPEAGDENNSGSGRGLGVQLPELPPDPGDLERSYSGRGQVESATRPAGGTKGNGNGSGSPSLTLALTSVFWRDIEVQDGLDLLSSLRQCQELGGPIIQARIDAKRTFPKCANCGNEIRGPYYNMFPVPDPKTGIQNFVYSCSARCYSPVQRREQEQKRLSMVR